MFAKLMFQKQCLDYNTRHVTLSPHIIIPLDWMNAMQRHLPDPITEFENCVQISSYFRDVKIISSLLREAGLIFL